jgi:hypothetical protein
MLRDREKHLLDIAKLKSSKEIA